MNLELWNEELRAEYSEEISTYGVHNKLEDDIKDGMIVKLVCGNVLNGAI